MGKVGVVRRAMNVSKELVCRMKKNALRGSAIFNPDEKRLQHPLRCSLKILRDVSNILKKEGLLTGRQLGNAVAIHSCPGCQQQQWHTDYDPLQMCNMTQKPLGVILALEDDTFFNTPGNMYTLQSGDILYFTGDTIHAGAAYTRENTRIHIYVDVPEVTRRKNSTYLIIDKVE